MPNYRRNFVPGGTYFFTVVTYRRMRHFEDEMSRKLLGEKMRECQARWPYEVNAIVLLPDHWHVLWTLPAGDAAYHRRLGWIKKEFTKEWLAMGGREGIVSARRRARGEHGVWQRRYWEHTIDTEHDFDRHFDYIHYNAVKHGYASSPCDWPHSSIHRWIKAGVYERDWGRSELGALDFSDLDETAMEME